ncbi:MAG: TetR/AcrR family transcriptional regulator [Bacteroidales bacterium]|jgi:AcrR family transcriptional regulator|nr:TetR/AcrR family transcriptional regulator [Bacteroidales bacterium]
MCPRTSHQFEDIRKEKRHLILESALVIFAKKGYHGASISIIASEAGISKGLIYNYFKSKEDILKETLIGGFEHIFQHYRFDPQTFTPKEFVNLIELTFDLLEKDHSHWKIYFSVLMQTEVMEIIQDKLMDILFPIIEDFKAYFKKLGYEKPLEEARFFGAIIDGLSLSYITDPENFPKEYCINRLKSIYNLPL